MVFSSRWAQGAKYLGFFFSHYLKIREKYITLAPFLYFSREILSFKNWKVNTLPSNTNWAKLSYFSLVLREREEKKTNKYFAPKSHDIQYWSPPMEFDDSVQPPTIKPLNFVNNFTLDMKWKHWFDYLSSFDRKSNFALPPFLTQTNQNLFFSVYQLYCTWSFRNSSS